MDIKLETDPKSLSPHRDAAAQAKQQLKEYYEPRFSSPGYEGVQPRVYYAIMTAYLDTFASERECGSTPHQIAEAIAEALGGIVASFGASLAAADGDPENMPAAIQFMLQRVAHNSFAVGNSDYVKVDYASPKTPEKKS